MKVYEIIVLYMAINCIAAFVSMFGFPYVVGQGRETFDQITETTKR
jgi:hypothetical protein